MRFRICRCCKIWLLQNGFGINPFEGVETGGRGGGREFPVSIHCKKRLSFFPSPAGMSLTKLSLVGNNLILPGQEDFGQLNPSRGREKPFFTV
jgi:hypothetical protein